MSCSRRHRNGFSLLEVMVVLVIIGLLAGLITINVRGRLIMARQNAAKMEIATLHDALESFYMIYGRYPTNQEGLAILTQATEKLAEPLLETPAIDPWGRPYLYNQPGRKTPYDVICLGADGSPGGEGADRDLSSDDLKEQALTKGPGDAP